MSEAAGGRTVPLGDVEPARSRHAGRRSAVALTAELLVAGLANGSVCAFDRRTGAERWTSPGAEQSGAVVRATPFAGGVAVGERRSDGEIRLHDCEDGSIRWRYRTAADVGDPQTDTRFFLPFVVGMEAVGDRLYAAARRYERDGDRRVFESVVYAFEPDGTVGWTFETDASPISLDADEGRVAVAYNRCPGAFQYGLAVLDAATGEPRYHWDPGTEGQRRVGDVSLLADGLAVASHGDYRGYRLESGGQECWRVDLARPTAVGEETLYAYPNHVHATDAGVAFVTGNTYPEEGRETDGRHPNAHAALGFTPAGDAAWRADVAGFATEVASNGDSIAVPAAQAFRTRDATDHGLGVFDVQTGRRRERDTAGIVTAVDVDNWDLVAIEEPVVYHDEGTEHGAYRLVVTAR
jgi:outer membrane protein assembly factor BamB